MNTVNLGQRTLTDTTHISVDTLALRNAVAPGGKTRKWGMLVTVIADNTTYELKRGLVDTNINNNANWQAFTGGGGGGGAATSLIYESYDASGGGYPTTFQGGAIGQFNHYIVTQPSPADGNGDIKFPLDCILISRIAAPGQLDANWKTIQA